MHAGGIYPGCCQSLCVSRAGARGHGVRAGPGPRRDVRARALGGAAGAASGRAHAPGAAWLRHPCSLGIVAAEISRCLQAAHAAGACKQGASHCALRHGRQGHVCVSRVARAALGQPACLSARPLPLHMSASCWVCAVVRPCLRVPRSYWLVCQVSDANLAAMPEFRQRVNVLQQLGYVSADSTVEVKVLSISDPKFFPHPRGSAACPAEALSLAHPP